MYRNVVNLFIAVASFAGLSCSAFAHHAVSVHYDTSDIAEFEGQVTSVRWANPHSIITVQGREAGAAETEWRIEAAAAATVLRSSMQRDAISVGDTIRAAVTSACRYCSPTGCDTYPAPTQGVALGWRNLRPSALPLYTAAPI